MIRSGTIHLLALAAVAFTVTTATAGKVKVWHHHSHAHYEKAQLRQSVVNSEGVLRLSRQLKPLTEISAAHVWEVIEDKDGNLYAATGGDEGRVYKVTPD